MEVRRHGTFVPRRAAASCCLLALALLTLPQGACSEGSAGTQPTQPPSHAPSGGAQQQASGHGQQHSKHGHRHVVPVAPVYEECYYSAHPFEGLVFLFTGITIGTTIMFLTLLPTFHGVQQSVVIFSIGMFYALFGEYYQLYKWTGMFGRSYCMWMNIDPHLLLFVMLPALITGDAMAIDTSVARNVYRQCIHLAGPGMLFCSFATALFLWLYLPYNWSFLMCLTVGSILAATDPVAVVNLLKELGASPALTVQIQGESLLNDGTAIVLYSVTYKMLQGEEFGTNDVVLFLLRVVLLAIVVGALIGWCCTVWIRLSCRRLDSRSSFVQISITLLCAYWSYIFAEGFFGMSGVLTTVASALVLADRMWPSIVSKESMDNAWHMFEFMGNTAIFFLAGSWTGNIMYQIEGKDYLHLFVLYLVCNIVRAVMLLLSLPILRLLGEDMQQITLADLSVMCWGGLRGAVGLSLAIHMSIDRASGTISEIDGKRVLFFTSGIAALTLLVNATTCPLLVKWLGIARTSKTRQTIMEAVHYQLVNMSVAETRVKAERRSSQTGHEEALANEMANIVGQIMEQVVEDVEHHVTGQHEANSWWRRLFHFSSEEEHAHASFAAGFLEGGSGGSGWSAKLSMNSVLSVDDGPQLIILYQSARQAHNSLSHEMLELLQLPQVAEPEDINDLFDLAVKEAPSRCMHRVVKEAFICLMRAQYWAMNDNGDFLDDHDVRSCLLQSLGSASENSAFELADLRFIVSRIRDEGDMTLFEVGYDFNMDILSLDHTVQQPVEELTGCGRIERSPLFGTTMVLIILANTVTVAIELSYHDPVANRYMPAINLFFALAYCVEFVIRFGALKWKYFRDPWNVFDFILLLIGIAGCVLEFVLLTEQINQSQSARIARVVKLFRILRNVRIGMRVILAAKQHGIARIDVTKGLGGIMMAIKQARSKDNTVLRVRYLHILTSFVKAHMVCQQQFVQYFGKNGKLESTEAARCLLSSQTEVLAAITMACSSAEHVQKPALIAMNVLRESNRIAQEMLHFVDDAHTNGILGAREAETIQHPLKAHMSKITRKLESVVQGDLANPWSSSGAFKDGLNWFRGAMSLPPVKTARSSAQLNGRRPSMSSLDAAMMGLREKLQTDGTSESFWNVKVHQTLSAKSSAVASVASVASDMHFPRDWEARTRDAELDSALQPRPCPQAPSPPPSLPPSIPPSIPPSNEPSLSGSPLASPRCPTPPPQDTDFPAWSDSRHATR